MIINIIEEKMKSMIFFCGSELRESKQEAELSFMDSTQSWSYLGEEALRRRS